MKNTFRIITVALFAITFFGSCNHTEKQEATHRIIYAVQNSDTYAGSMSAPTQLSLSDEEWDNMLDQFCDYVASGNTVTFYNTDNAQFSNPHSGAMKAKSSTKESNNIKTNSREEMKNWCRRMEEAGLTVVMDYDSKTGTWSGYAYSLPPSMAGQIKTYICPISDVMGDYTIIMTVDTVLHKMYVTSAIGGFGIDVNIGVNNYKYFNPADSGMSVNPAWTYIYMNSLISDSAQNGRHFAITTAPAYCFMSPSFSMVPLYNVNNQLNFSETSQYETWVCEENGFSIVMHVDKTTMDTTSYSFDGQMAIQFSEAMQSGFLSSIGGLFNIISVGNSNTPGSDENFNISMSGDADNNYGVDLVSDDLVVWHMGDYDLVFHRM